jgi:hypothetical protein
MALFGMMVPNQQHNPLTVMIGSKDTAPGA